MSTTVTYTPKKKSSRAVAEVAHTCPPPPGGPVIARPYLLCKVRQLRLPWDNLLCVPQRRIADHCFPGCYLHAILQDHALCCAVGTLKDGCYWAVEQQLAAVCTQPLHQRISYGLWPTTWPLQLRTCTCNTNTRVHTTDGLKSVAPSVSATLPPPRPYHVEGGAPAQAA